MKWEQELETMESKVEQSEGEKGTEIKPITTLDDLKEEISKVLDTISTIKQLQELGEDVSEALEITKEQIKKLIDIGIEKFGLPEETAREILDNISNEETNSKRATK
ncbi:MAG: hypothetical protein IKF82_01665 [Bacilli bacterium]|nr:hypothetical protein [Bacilli bacterium]